MLANPTLALEAIDGQRVAITLPRGAIVQVLDGNVSEDRLTDAASA